MEDEKLYSMARKRVQFRRHFFVYILVNISLFIIWYISRKPGITNYWFLYPLAIWAIGLAFHYWNAFYDDKSSVEKEFRKLKKSKAQDQLAEPTESNTHLP